MSSQQIKEVNDAKEKTTLSTRSKEITRDKTLVAYATTSAEEWMYDYQTYGSRSGQRHIKHMRHMDKKKGSGMMYDQQGKLGQSQEVSRPNIVCHPTQISTPECQKEPFYDKVKEVEDNNGLPEVILDDEGYAKLPSYDEAFTYSHELVPWGTITASESEYLAADSVLENFVSLVEVEQCQEEIGCFHKGMKLKLPEGIELSPWASWLWQELYLPKDIHQSKDIDKLLEDASLIEAAMQANFNDNVQDEEVKNIAKNDREDKEKGDKKEIVRDKVGNQESRQRDKLQNVERDVDIQMQKVQKNNSQKPEAE
ncbi:hypothetical protein BDR06DRAFT_974567 [Suillus hirtellus]|nr:hypothetical protein BDR06DRAFT_974567 [Suillus hirtellus]